MNMKRLGKYNNRTVIVDNIKFSSKREADRYCELKILERHGHIKNLQLQPKFVILPKYEINGRKVRAIHYIADFKYEDKNTGEVVIEDVKGVKTEVYKLKKKLFEYNTGLEIQEI